MNEAFREKTARMAELMKKLRNSNCRDWSNRSELPKKGVYVFYEKDCAMYAGRTRNLQRRIREHGAESSTRHSATLAMVLLREELCKVLKKHECAGSPLTREQIEKRYPKEFAEQRERIRKMTFQFVKICDDEEQVLFELYASIALPTRYNSFRTT